MHNRIQKTIIAKYIQLIEETAVTENQLSELHDAILKLYRTKILISSDVYLPKIELIAKHLETEIETLKRKRVHKTTSLENSKDLIKIFKNDLDGVDYHKTALEDLKDFENKHDLEISVSNVGDILKHLVIPKRKISSEQDFEKYVSERLIAVFGKEKVYRQYSIGGFLALKTDIDVGNGKVGIELKVADNLSATDMQRMIGQVTYYKKRFYGENLLVFIVGKSEISPTMRELIEFIEEMNISVIYAKAI